MADKIYVYELAKPGDITALKEVLKSLAFAWLGPGSSAEVSPEGFITMQSRSVSGNVPADEAAARKAGEEALRKLLEYAGNMKAKQRVLIKAVFNCLRLITVTPPVDSKGSWRLVYRPFLSARPEQRTDGPLLLADDRAYVALETGGNGRVVSLQIHLRPIVRQFLEAASDLGAQDVLVRIAQGGLFRVVYRVDWEQGIYAPYFISAVGAEAFIQGRRVEGIGGLLIPAIGRSRIEEPKAEGCFCNRNFTEEELRSIIILIRKGTIMNESSGATVYDESKDRIFYLNKDEKVGDNSMATFTKSLNNTLAAYGIERCITKIHFLAQAYHESLGFRSTYEKAPNSNVKDCNRKPDVYYRGRGLIQLTHCLNYKAFFDSIKQELKEINEEYKTENMEIPDEKLKELIPLVAKDLHYSCISSGWYWLKSGANRYAIMDDASKVSAAINLPLALTEPKLLTEMKGLKERLRLTAAFKKAMNYDNCKNK